MHGVHQRVLGSRDERGQSMKNRGRAGCGTSAFPASVRIGVKKWAGQKMKERRQVGGAVTESLLCVIATLLGDFPGTPSAQLLHPFFDQLNF